jgi:hypothetical protein
MKHNPQRSAEKEHKFSRVPNGVRFGPLTSSIWEGAAWMTQDEFPSSQLWADEIERILSYVQAQGKFEYYLGALRGNANQRDSAIAELRVAFYFHRNQFPVIEWKPAGENGNEGEYLIRSPEFENIFVEVKAPGWEGELSQKERESGRIRLGKHIDREARAIAPWERIQFAIDKAYKKFMSSSRNLLIIADDLFVSLEHGTDMHANMAFYSSSNNGRFANARYARIGGIGFFWVKNNGKEIWYEMKLFLNPYCLETVRLPESFIKAFHGKSKIALR